MKRNMSNKHLEKANIPEKCLSIIDDAINKYSINSFNYKYTKNVLELEEIGNQSDATLFFNDISDDESELKTYSSILIDDSKLASNINSVMNKRIINSTSINKNILEILKHVQELNKSNKINNFIRKMEYNEIKELIFINTKLLRNTIKKIYNILNGLLKNKTLNIYNSAEDNFLYDNFIKNKSQNDYKKLYKKNRTIFKKYIILQKYYKKIYKKYKEENEYLKNLFLAKKFHDQNVCKNGAKGDKKKDKNVISGINHNIINETIKDQNLIDINYKKNNRKNLYSKKNKLINWKRVKEYRECSEAEHFIKKREKNICTNNYLTISKNENTKDYNVGKNMIPSSTDSLVGGNLNQFEKKASIVSELGMVPSQRCAENKQDTDANVDADVDVDTDVDANVDVDTDVDANAENEELYMSENVEANSGMIEVTDLKFESDNVDKREPVVDGENGKQ